MSIKCKKHFSNRDITCTECNDCFFANCRNQAVDLLFGNICANATTNKQVDTPLTEEILLEAMEKIEGFQKKENMQKLLREFLEAIEKNDIKEILFTKGNNAFIKKQQAIFYY